MSWQTYIRCTACSGRAQPGTVALLTYLLQKYPYTTSMGIYACRNVANTSTLSQHACGRALDLGIPTNPDGSPRRDLGDPVTIFLYDNSTFLGLTEDIYARVRYSAAHPRGAYYGGVHPHYDHHHISQTPTRATTLTYAEIVSELGLPGGDPMLGFVIGKLGDATVKGEQAHALQLLLLDRGEKLPQWGADGAAGDETRMALRSFQTKHGMVAGHDEYANGKIGPFTYTWLQRGLGGAVDLSNLVTKATFAAHKHDEGQTGPPT